MKQRFLARLVCQHSPPLGKEETFHGPFPGQREAMLWAEEEIKGWPKNSSWSTHSLWDPHEGDG